MAELDSSAMTANQTCGTGRRPRVSVPDDRWLGLEPPSDDADRDVDVGGDVQGVEVVLWDMLGPPPGPLDLVVTPYMQADAALPRLASVPGLAVVQTLTAGYDNVLPHLPVGVSLCSARGVHDASTAELAVGLAIAAQRGIGEAAQDAMTGAWKARTRPSLADRRVLIIGTGGVGSAIADRLAPFEIELTRVATTARQDERGVVRSIDDLDTILPRQEIVVLACPLTPRTRGLVDQAFLARLPDGALIVNVSRGPVVDTDALMAQLSSGRVRAALDVTDPEPLPAEHPLWRSPGVLITPHVGGNSSAFVPRARALLADQFWRLAQAQPLRNVVAGPAR